MTLTANEIADLARFAGFRLDEANPPDEDEGQTTYAIEECPKGGLIGDEGERLQYRMIAYLDEYPEEGSYGLGPRLPLDSEITP